MDLNQVTVPCTKLVLLLLAAMSARICDADEVPHSPVVFYLHGQIIEEQGPRPVHERWGLYDYPAVVDALGSSGAKVISEVRARGTDVTHYANQVAEEIEALISDGVSPERIVVVGFSKGGVITIFVSDRLNHPEIRYVLLAACSDWLSSVPDVRLTGHVLSIMEKSDTLGRSCKKLAERNDELGSFQEVKIRIGKEHGAFYLPRQEWLDPVLDWIHG